MKSTIVALSLIIVSLSVWAQDDSLLINRSSLYYQYLDVKNNTEEFTATDQKNLNAILEQLVQFDNRVIDTLDARSKQNVQLKKDAAVAATLVAEREKEKAHWEFLHLILLIGGGLLLAVFILLIVLLAKRSAVLKKLKREVQAARKSDNAEIRKLQEDLAMFESKISDRDLLVKRFMKEKDSLQLEVENRNKELQSVRLETASRIAELESAIEQHKRESKDLQPELDRLRTVLAEKEKLINGDLSVKALAATELEKQVSVLKAEIHDLKDVIDNFQETLREKDHANEHLEREIENLKRKLEEKQGQLDESKQRAPHDDAYFARLTEIDLSMVKLEKLERLRDKNILTPEEYQVLKQKFLDLF